VALPKVTSPSGDGTGRPIGYGELVKGSAVDGDAAKGSSENATSALAEQASDTTGLNLDSGLRRQ